MSVDGLDDNGIGTGLDARGRRWTIRGAIPGSRVLAGGKPGGGVLLDVVEAPTDAIPAPCPQFGTCGGCLYQPMPRAEQQAQKLARLTTLLAPLSAPNGGILGTPDDVRADALHALKYGAPGGGYIYGASHSLAVGTKPENLEAMRRTLAECGTYPIRL